MRISPALGWALLAYGVLGLTLVAVGMPVAIDLAGRFERLSTSIDGTLRAATSSANAAADGLDGLDTNLSQAEDSTATAAILARDAAATLDSLAGAMELSILGTQPLLPLADDFAATAGQARSLGDELDGIGASLALSGADLTIVTAELRDLATELEELRGASADAPTGTPPIRLFLILLLAWVALPALAAIAAGGAILRGGTGTRAPA